MSSNAHVPVLLGPVLRGLKIDEGGCYVDATFGRGGHSREILQQLGSSGRLIGIDRDPEAIASAGGIFSDDCRVELIRGCCAQLEKIVNDRNIKGKVDGILLDLGVSSPQLDDAHRGFSFMRDGPLDMRMDPGSGISARQWLASVEESELKQVISRLGEERHASRIASAVVAARATIAIETTSQLAAIVAAAVPAMHGRHGRRRHPATKTFQAIRMMVNQELEQLASTLDQTVDVLRPGGRLCVISFHSLEDRMVKRFMRTASLEPEPYRGMPSVPQEFQPKLKIVGKAITATPEEVDANRRARSARLRVAERL